MAYSFFFFFLLIWYEKQMLTTVIKIFLRDLTWAVKRKYIRGTEELNKMEQTLNHKIFLIKITLQESFVAGNSKAKKKKKKTKQHRAVRVKGMHSGTGISFMPLVKGFHLYSLPSEKPSDGMFWVAADSGSVPGCPEAGHTAARALHRSRMQNWCFIATPPGSLLLLLCASLDASCVI